MAKRKARKRTPSAWEKRTIRELDAAGVLTGDPSDPRYILFLAIATGQTKEAKRLIDEGIDVNDCYDRDIDAGTMFQHAASKGNLELAKYMVKRGADPNLAGPEGTALHCAARYGHDRVYEYLKPRTAPTHHALAERLWQDGERRPREEREAARRLSHASLMGQLPTVRKLLAQGIDVNVSTIGHHGGTALHAAAQGGHVEIVKLLLKAGADPNAESYDGVTPLANVANDDVCKALLSAGVDVNHRDHGGCTPLMGAILEDVFRRQVRAGAEMTVVDHRGHGVLLHVARTVERRKAWAVPKALKTDSAFDEGLAAIFRRLIRASVSVNDQYDDDGRTALMLAASLDLRKSTAELLKAGADPLAEDNDGKTALAYAKTRSPLRKQLSDAEKK